MTINPSTSRTIINISKDIERIYELIEQYADPETGELNIPARVEKDLQKFTGQLNTKADAIGFAQIKKEKEIEALKQMKASITARQKTIENSINRVKKFLAPICRRYGTPAGKRNLPALQGQVIKIKDNSRYEYELDADLPKQLRKTHIDDYPIKYRTVSITIPLQKYQQLLQNGFDENICLSVDHTGLNKDKLKEDYQKEFNKLNSVKENTKAASLPLTKPKNKIKYPNITGIKQIWKDNVTILGLKKLEEHK